jgi:hypothetical protein
MRKRGEREQEVHRRKVVDAGGKREECKGRTSGESKPGMSLTNL